MRIIAGKYGSLKLQMVDSALTRETSDKVRGAVLNSLSYQVKNSTVLDLFSGTGSYGLESLSRGAKTVYFVDKQPKAIQTINANIKSLKVSEETHVIQSDYDEALKSFKSQSIKFDVIILDPPYAFGSYETLLNDLSDLLNEAGVIACEVHKQTLIDEQALTRLSAQKEKVYGIKKIIYYEPK